MIKIYKTHLICGSLLNNQVLEHLIDLSSDIKAKGRKRVSYLIGNQHSVINLVTLSLSTMVFLEKDWKKELYLIGTPLTSLPKEIIKALLKRWMSNLVILPQQSLNFNKDRRLSNGEVGKCMML